MARPFAPTPSGEAPRPQPSLLCSQPFICVITTNPHTTPLPRLPPKSWSTPTNKSLGETMALTVHAGLLSGPKDSASPCKTFFGPKDLYCLCKFAFRPKNPVSAHCTASVGSLKKPATMASKQNCRTSGDKGIAGPPPSYSPDERRLVQERPTSHISQPTCRA